MRSPWGLRDDAVKLDRNVILEMLACVIRYYGVTQEPGVGGSEVQGKTIEQDGDIQGQLQVRGKDQSKRFNGGRQWQR